MNAAAKHKLFDQLCLDAHWLEVLCSNEKGGPLPERRTVNDIMDRARKVSASAQAFANAMIEHDPSVEGYAKK